MIDETLLHDLKRIADNLRALMLACDALYKDLEESSGNLPDKGRISIMDIQKGGLYGKFNDHL